MVNITTHKATFMGSVNRLIYVFDNLYPWGVKEIFPRYTLVESKLIEECQLDNPPLKAKEKIFIESIGKTVLVKEVVRSTSGGYIYYTDHVIEKLEDNKTEESKQEAEEEQKEWIEYLEESRRKEVERNNRNSSWWSKLVNSRKEEN